MATRYGVMELALMEQVHAVWYAFKYLTMDKWGPEQLRLAKWMDTHPEPEQPTGLLDMLLLVMWGVSEWTMSVMRSIQQDA